jgi:hypothetical protein
MGVLPKHSIYLIILIFVEKKIMKDYGMPFKNAAIDKLGSKFGKDKPTHQPVDFKANAEKRMQERSDVVKPSWNSGGEYNVNKTKISSLKDPSKIYYDNTISDRGYSGNELRSKSRGAYDDQQSKGSSSLAFWNEDKQKMQVENTHMKMRTLAPSYVDPKGPSTLQGVKKKI